MFQNGINSLSQIDDAFCQKAQNIIWFGLSDNVHILLACGTNTY